MKAAVTGANGFVGSHVVARLVGEGVAVRAVVRESSDLRSIEDLPVELFRADILEPGTLTEAFAGCDIVFHVAAVFAYWGYRAEELRRISGEGTSNVIRAAHASGVKRIVLTSSSVVLGSSDQPRVVRESDEGGPDLRDEPPYVAAKADQEALAFELGRRLGIEVVAVRPTITVGGRDYGPTESNRMILNYLKDPLRSTWFGGCNIVSVTDVARGHWVAAMRGTAGRGYLLGGENLEWSEVHRHISQLCGLGGPFVVNNHTSAYLAASAFEVLSFFTGQRPASSRAQAKMVGRYYWYGHEAMAALGYRPKPARESLAEALSWLVASPHVSSDLRAEMTLAPEIRTFRHAD